MTGGGSGALPALPGARVLLNRHGLRPKKSWGQNFLTDPRALARIADAAVGAPGQTVVEIGAGLGALTGALLARSARVVAIERDPDLVAVLRAELGSLAGLEVVALDALDFDFTGARAKAGLPVLVAGNLPYQITTPLLFRVLEAAAGGQTIARAVFMVQKEVAQRLGAAPGTAAYGRLTVMVQQLAEVEVLFHVAAGSFLPPPAVTSSVFRLTPRAAPRAPVRDGRLFAAVVRASFEGRRKMLRRALEPRFDGAHLATVFAAAGLAGTERGETLSVERFAALTNALYESGARGA